MPFKRLLAAKGIHYLVTRFGPPRLRSVAFDEKFRGGAWGFRDDGAEMPLIISKHLRGGDLLMLGCGSASLLASLEPGTFSSVLGVDLSKEAIRRAEEFASERVSFVVGDMTKFQCSKPYDVVLLSECLNYVTASQQVEMLMRFSGSLKTGGAIIVTLAEAKRYHEIIERIRRNFALAEDRSFVGSTRHLLVITSVRSPAE